MILRLGQTVKSFFYQHLKKRLMDVKVVTRQDMRSIFPSYVYGEPSHLALSSEHYRFTNIEKPFFLDNFVTSHEFEPPFYSIVEQAFLCGRYATAVTSDSRILLESVCGSRGYLAKGGDAKFILGYKYLNTEREVDCALSLVNVLSNTYFHWVAEVLPVLQAFFAFIRHHGIRPKVIVDHPISGFQQEYLSLLGIHESDLIFWKFRKAKVNQLIVPSLFYDLLMVDELWGYHIYSKVGFDWLRKQLRGIPEPRKTQKLLIDRSDAKARRIINRDETMQYFRKLSYREVQLTDLAVRDQIDLFSTATHVAASHGAGLVNSIFADHLIINEFYPIERRCLDPYYFYQISSMYGHNHHLFGMSSVNEHLDMELNFNMLAEWV